MDEQNKNFLIRTTQKSNKNKSHLLNFSTKKENKSCFNQLPSLFINNQSFSELEKSIVYSRKISKTPYKILDAPDLEDDFYQVVS